MNSSEGDVHQCAINKYENLLLPCHANNVLVHELAKKSRVLWNENEVTPVSLFKEQPEAELNFPTVPFPNREKGQEVVTIPFAVAEKNHSTVILANNPDCSRFQFAEQQKE